ncbi:MAG: bifunctional hydroxymethylpyrimidine kinase/phosphomethylpyrimidine kinase [Pseudomonadota bacterium]
MIPPRILIIAGSDPSGGAGVQADIKTVTALRGYAMAAITALTVQDTRGVHAVHGVPADVVAAQARACLEDIDADAVKIGMLGSAETVAAVAELLRDFTGPIVLDPVLAATSGDSLATEGVREAILDRLLPLATLATPNRPETEALAGGPITTLEEREAAGRRLLKRGARAVLAKDGDGTGDRLVDLLVTADGTARYEDARIETRHTHGTGCTLASAIAVELAKGADIETAVGTARAYVRRAIETAPGFGAGHGPVNHLVTLS